METSSSTDLSFLPGFFSSAIFSGMSLGTSIMRRASVAMALKTGPAAEAPMPPSPAVRLMVTTIASCGFVTGVNPMKDAL